MSIDTIPAQLQSDFFRISIHGQRSRAFHAVSGYYLLSFELAGPVSISVIASDPHFWDHGVQVQPMRLGIRPHRRGNTITFAVAGPGKYVVMRPGDHFADAKMLFLFANSPERKPTSITPGLRYYPPGIYHENIDAQSGDQIYLAPGAVIFGALNIWQVHDVHVFGRGTIIYDGPQNPKDDEGWMHKPNWHCIVMDNAHNIEVDGITCIVRSRTWQIQMRDSRNIGFYNLKVVGGSANNANQDGMDWLGGGDTTVANTFFRAADDDFALEGNWDGYSPEAMARPGHDVSNITIRDSVVSTSISNIMRVNWPRKHFNSYHVQMKNMDVLHTGFGSCGVPFAVFELWADPAGGGSHTDYLLENIRLDDWYSLTGIRQPNPSVSDIRFHDIWAMDSPGMVPSAMMGNISGVFFDNVDVYGDPATDNSGIPLLVSGGAGEPMYQHVFLNASFSYESGVLRPRTSIAFEAHQRDGARYQWLFGDGSTATGPAVRHTFSDAKGTLLDGSGRFRVLLHVTDKKGDEAWSSRSVVISNEARSAVSPTQPLAAGWKTSTLPNGETRYDGYIAVPAEGGYTLNLLTSTTAQMVIDDALVVHSPNSQAQVCGSIGNAVQPLRLSAVLRQGLHRITIVKGAEPENAVGNPKSTYPLLLWEGPDRHMQPVPELAIYHAQAAVQ
ncbi:MAG: PKD domain-containing protein [Candidatus Sulfotelmatobacter sp.]